MTGNFERRCPTVLREGYEGMHLLATYLVQTKSVVILWALTPAIVSSRTYEKTFGRYTNIN